MKIALKYLFILMSFFLVNSCSSDDDADQGLSDAEVIEIARNRIVDGEWRITFFQDDNQDETSDFEDFNFNYHHNNNSVEASQDVDVYLGSWNVTVVNESINFNLNFDLQTPNNLNKLNGNWNVRNILEDRIVLKKSLNYDLIYLTFNKI